jgi:hypothetical protein
LPCRHAKHEPVAIVGALGAEALRQSLPESLERIGRRRDIGLREGRQLPRMRRIRTRRERGERSDDENDRADHAPLSARCADC